MERSERDHQLQDTILQHCGESTTGRWSERVLLQVWKNTPHPPWTPLHKTPPATPLSPTRAIQISEDEVRQVFQKQKRKKAPGPDCYSSLSEILCWPAGPHLHKDLQQITGTVRSPLMLQTLHHHPIPKKSKITGLHGYRPVALMSVVMMKLFEKLVLTKLKDIPRSSSVCLQSKQVCGRCSQHGSALCSATSRHVRILFVDFSSAFNTIIPNLLLPKLTQLSVPTSICEWITSFLTDKQQLMRLGKYTSNTRTISTGAPQGCVLSPLLLYTNYCTSKDLSVKLLKFADDTTLISLIQDGDESTYRQEVKELAVWCHLNNLELKTVETPLLSPH